MANKKIDIEILAKRVELLEITVRELKAVEPEVLEERLKRLKTVCISLRKCSQPLNSQNILAFHSRRYISSR